MKTTDFSTTPTSNQLNESMFKKFGTRINFEKYTREELENYRNLLRTKVNQTESQAGFNDLLANEGHQKDKFMLELLNTRIKEMLGESALNEKAVSKAQQKFMGMVHAAQKGEKPASKEVAKVAKGMKKKDAKDFASTKHKGLPEKKTDESIEVAEWQTDSGWKPATKKDARGKVTNLSDKARRKTADDEKNKDKQDMKQVKEASKKAKKDWDGDGKVETEKDEVWGSRMKAAKKAGKMEEDSNFEKTKTSKGTRYSRKHDAEGHSKGNDGETAKSSDKPARLPTSLKGGHNDTQARLTAASTQIKGRKIAGKAQSAPQKEKTTESTLKNDFRMIIEGLRSFIAEDEEGKAKDITAGTDMVNDFTSWMQRIGQYQTKTMIELADSIRANFGQAESDAFKAAIQPALQEALSSLTQSRESITRAVAVLAGEEAAVEPMGVEPTGDMGDLDAAPDTMNEPTEDEFGASDAAAGGSEVAGREMRESREVRRARKLAEAHSIMSKLSK